jgi:hypothetical protein
MSVPDSHVIQYHLDRGFENGFVSLRLPELDVEAVRVIADPPIGFLDDLHISLFLRYKVLQVKLPHVYCFRNMRVVFCRDSLRGGSHGANMGWHGETDAASIQQDI